MGEKFKNESNKQEKASKFPDAFSLLIIITAICTILTYIIPSGTFDMITLESGREVVDPATFHYIEQTPVSLLGFLQAIPKGLVESAQIVFFIFIIGGAFEVANATGALTAGIGKITKVFNGKENILIPLIIFIISFGANAFGMFEEVLPFVTLMVSMSIAMGMDSITGAAMLLIGVGAGTAGTFMNPFTIGVAQGIAGLPLFSGMEFRIVCFIGMTLISISYVMLYARKVKKNPSVSLMYEIDSNRTDKLDLDSIQEFGIKEKSVVFIILAAIVIMIFGVMKYKWYIMEMAAVFLGMSMAIAIITRMELNTYSNSLINGMKGIASGALVVGFARAVIVVLNEGNIMHTILYASTSLLKGTSSYVCAIGMYILQCLLSFVVPSGSGQAAISMPILSSIADIVGVTRQTAVIAFQFGDGISNIITPTSGTFMAALALAKIPWTKWIKWILPLAAMQYLFGAIMVIVANMIQLGPF